MHVPASLLAAYANGSLPTGLSLAVAGHLTFCPPCRQAVARLEALGGGLLAATEPAEMSADACEAALARLDLPEPRPEPAAPLPPDPEGWLPHPVRQALGIPASTIRWRFRLPGLAEHSLSGFGEESVSLLRGRPGVRIPSHTHSGLEATLVLTGEMRDTAAHYRRGDIALADEQLDHHPEIVGDTPCVCLVVRTGRMRFTGRFGRALNLFT